MEQWAAYLSFTLILTYAEDSSRYTANVGEMLIIHEHRQAGLQFWPWPGSVEMDLNNGYAKVTIVAFTLVLLADTWRSSSEPWEERIFVWRRPKMVGDRP
jgi:hypothetical protein